MNRPARDAFSLLEVLLAMSILLGAVVVLGELARIGRKNAQAAKELTQAQLLCETKLNEILAGIDSSTPREAAAFEEHPDEWLYTVERTPLAHPGVVSLRVTVKRNLPDAYRPAQFSLVRWIRDPEATAGATVGPSTSGETFAPPVPSLSPQDIGP